MTAVHHARRAARRLLRPVVRAGRRTRSASSGDVDQPAQRVETVGSVGSAPPVDVAAAAASAEIPEGLTPEQRRHWDDNGCLVLRGLFPPDRLAAFETVLDELWANRRRSDNPVVVDVHDGTRPRRYFRDAADESRLVVHTLNDLYLVEPAVRDINLDDRLVGLLTELLGDEPCVISSLNHEYGSERAFHFDTWFAPPPVDDQLVVSFVAFEDIDADNGPLQYYPGSHRMPPYRFSNGRLRAISAELPDCARHTEAWLADRNIEHRQFHCKAGDVFLGHAQLFHGASPILDHDRTRRSMVTRYLRSRDLDPAVVDRVTPSGAIHRRDHQTVRRWPWPGGL
jgi:phytanoyl-CoA hydroxylase